GKQGVPRRVWDITYQNARIPTEVFNTPVVDFSLLLLGIGAIVAVIGGASFVGIMVATVLFGKRAANPLTDLRVVPPQGIAMERTDAGVVGEPRLPAAGEVSAAGEGSVAGGVSVADEAPHAAGKRGRSAGDQDG